MSHQLRQCTSTCNTHQPATVIPASPAAITTVVRVVALSSPCHLPSRRFLFEFIIVSHFTYAGHQMGNVGRFSV